jgi:hypothetical protein
MSTLTRMHEHWNAGFFRGVLLGLMLGFIITTISAIILSLPDAATADNMRKILDRCETDLPRTQNCAVVAIPEEKVQIIADKFGATVYSTED